MRFKKIVYSLQKCETKAEFDSKLNSMSQRDGFPINKIEAIKKTSRFYAPLLALGHRTNNAAEAQNSFLKMSNFKNLTEIFCNFEERAYNTITNMGNNTNPSDYVDYIYKKFQKYDRLLNLRLLVWVDPKKVGEKVLFANFKVKYKNKTFHVKYRNSKFECECQKMTEREFPCKHTYTIIKALPNIFSLNNYVSPRYHKEVISKLIEDVINEDDRRVDYKSTIKDLIIPCEYISKNEKRKDRYE